MNQEKEIPTAEEFYNSVYDLSFPEVMIEFAKLHVDRFSKDISSITGNHSFIEMSKHYSESNIK